MTEAAGRKPIPTDEQPEPQRLCELCGSIVIERNCKIVCLNCGYQRDCSDP